MSYAVANVNPAPVCKTAQTVARMVADVLADMPRNSGYGWASRRTATIADLVSRLRETVSDDVMRDVPRALLPIGGHAAAEAFAACLTARVSVARPIGRSVMIAGKALCLALYARRSTARTVDVRSTDTVDLARATARRSDAVYVGETRRVMDRLYSELADPTRDAMTIPRRVFARLPIGALRALQARVAARIARVGECAVALDAVRALDRAIDAQSGAFDAAIDRALAEIAIDTANNASEDRAMLRGSARVADRKRIAREVEARTDVDARISAAQATADSRLRAHRADVAARKAQLSVVVAAEDGARKARTVTGAIALATIVIPVNVRDCADAPVSRFSLCSSRTNGKGRIADLCAPLLAGSVQGPPRA